MSTESASTEPTPEDGRRKPYEEPKLEPRETVTQTTLFGGASAPGTTVLTS